MYRFFHCGMEVERQIALLICFYWVLMIHKPGTPLRRIVSLRRTLLFCMTSWLSSNLSFSHTRRINDHKFCMQITENRIMVPFDLISLFLSILRQLTEDMVRELLEENRLKLVEDYSRTILLRCCGSVSKPISLSIAKKGTHMGLIISSVLAELVLKQFEKIALMNSHPKLYQPINHNQLRLTE